MKQGRQSAQVQNLVERSSEILARFALTPELWFAASRLILRRQHRWLSWRVTSPVVLTIVLVLVVLDRSRWFDEGLLPVLILLNLILALGGAALLLTPVLIRHRFDAVYRRLPAANREAVWRFSPFGVSAEGGMTRFDGTWDNMREIVATPEFFLIYRQEKSAAVIPRTAFADAEAVEDFVFMAKERVPHFVELAS